MWNKVNLRAKDKNLPPLCENVMFAENDNFHNSWHKFIGQNINNKYIDYGYGRKEFKSGMYWMVLPDDPE